MNQTYSLQEGYRRRTEGNIPYPYVTVVRDGDMAYVDSNHLLLKIHGDVQNMNSLVLCEDDYLEYSDSHILMSCPTNEHYKYLENLIHYLVNM